MQDKTLQLTGRITISFEEASIFDEMPLSGDKLRVV